MTSFKEKKDNTLAAIDYYYKNNSSIRKTANLFGMTHTVLWKRINNKKHR